MIAPRYLRHITLDTGHQRDSYRSEVADDVVALLRPLIDDSIRLRAPVPVPVPGLAGYVIEAMGGRNRALMVSVWGPLSPAVPQARPLLVEFAVAPTSLAGSMIWRDWDASPGGRPPSAPWCVVSMSEGLAEDPEAAQWLGDLERCIAWAWIDG